MELIMLIMIRRSGIILIVMVIALTYLIMNMNKRKEAHVNADGNRPTCVIIDAGHGTPDGGAVSPDGVLEKDINLAIALALETQLNERGINTLMTRLTDDGIFDQGLKTPRDKKRSDLKNRRNLVNAGTATLLVSIHSNKYPDSSQKGAQVFYPKGSDKSQKIAEMIQEQIKTQIQPDNKRQAGVISGDIYLMKNLTIPGVLVECGFLSNESDTKDLIDEKYQQTMAKAIADAIQFMVQEGGL